jgi:hypothetical protein
MLKGAAGDPSLEWRPHRLHRYASRYEVK